LKLQLQSNNQQEFLFIISDFVFLYLDCKIQLNNLSDHLNILNNIFLLVIHHHQYLGICLIQILHLFKQIFLVKHRNFIFQILLYRI